MKVLQINSVPYGSTATISYNISKIAQKCGIECILAYGYSYHPQIARNNYIQIGNRYDKALHLILSKLTGLHGCFSHLYTYKFIRFIDKYKPDIIHVHNLHGWFINIPMLVHYINMHHIKIVWTLHDCWSFTGHCPYYDLANCTKWKTGCYNCLAHSRYPSTFFDCSSMMYKLKKKWFCSIENMTIVTPSKWLQQQVRQSFLSNKRCIVINNGIDLNKYIQLYKKNINNKKFKILCVSFEWSTRKGIDVIIQLANLLDSEKYEITIVGTDKQIDSILPSNIKSIHRTQNQQELIQIYNDSDVFVNTTREENFPTVNIESLACGLPVITFDTGGSPEIIDKTCGIVVEKNNVVALAKAIMSLKETPLSRDACRTRSLRYNQDERFMDYIDLYREIYGK